jgi:hypothetical protein
MKMKLSALGVRENGRADLGRFRAGMRVTVYGLPAIFCRALAYRHGCIFKGCHVKRQARPLNTFKFINGEGYTPARLYNTVRRAGGGEERTHTPPRGI